MKSVIEHQSRTGNKTILMDKKPVPAASAKLFSGYGWRDILIRGTITHTQKKN